MQRKGTIVGDFLQNNWFWIVVFVFFIWMHSSGMGCGGHGGHGGHGDRDRKKPEEREEHQH